MSSKLKRREIDKRFDFGSILKTASRKINALFKAGTVATALFIAALLAVIYFAALPGAPSPASSGKSFPPELIIDSSVRRNGNYSVNYEKITDQYTAGYSSSKSIEDLFSRYGGYFKKNGWTITNEITKYSDSRGLYAKRSGAEASVAIIDRDSKSREVLVSLVGR